jgi:hypothetical protein
VVREVSVAFLLATIGCSVQTSAISPDSGAADGASGDGSVEMDGTVDARPDTAFVADADAAADGDGGFPADWWDRTFARRHRLTFDNSAQTDALDGFPVLVVLTVSRVDYSVMASDGTDLRFVDDDHVTVLPHEIERFDEGGNTFVWVRVPRIDAESTDDHIWLYYGNTAAADAQRPAEVWSDGYHAVYHLEGDGLADSTGNHPPLSAFGESAPVEGRVAGARRFDGVDDYLDTGCTDQLDSLTVTAWARAAATPQSTFISGPLMREQNYQLTWDHTLPEFRGAASLKAPDWRGATFGTLAADTWYLLGATYEGSVLRAWVDGRMSAENTDVSGPPETSAHPARIARHAFRSDAETPYFEGDVDEVRIVAAPRTASWMNAQALSMTDSFITYE